MERPRSESTNVLSAVRSKTSSPSPAPTCLGTNHTMKRRPTALSMSDKNWFVPPMVTFWWLDLHVSVMRLPVASSVHVYGVCAKKPARTFL